MITVKAARHKIIQAAWRGGRKERVSIAQAAGAVLSENTYSTVDSPSFTQSNMDGYAFAFQDFSHKPNLKLSIEVQAAGLPPKAISKGEAMRIFTGAALPEGADTVVMQEYCRVENGQLYIDIAANQGQHVRPQGAQVQRGQLALARGHKLSPASIAYLAMLGISEVEVWAKPKIGIIVTGKELVAPNIGVLAAGQVFECNGLALQALLSQFGLAAHTTLHIDDEQAEITKAVESLLPHVDILLLTGGVSVGDFDFVAAALAAAGVKKLFHRVKQKPGKPFYFGRKKQALVLALPGNPASVLTCAYQYLMPAISGLMRRSFLHRQRLKLAESYGKAAGLRHFVRAAVDADGRATIFKQQDSFRLDTYARATYLLELPEEQTEFSAGDWLWGLKID
jgi:molybdopterin molybdotransferase